MSTLLITTESVLALPCLLYTSPVFVEPLLKYDPLLVCILTRGTGTLIGG